MLDLAIVKAAHLRLLSQWHKLELYKVICVRKRFREYGLSFGKLEPALRNLISDVPGVKVGHLTLACDSPTVIRTGITAIVIEQVYERPLPAACSVLNGFGKSLGLMQIEELGEIETPIILTNTLSVGYAFQGLVEYMLKIRKFRTLNPVVCECNDGFLNDILYPAVKPSDVARTIESAREDFELGSVGAGTGMVSFGFKGGIGSSSRKLIDSYTMGALVLANFGAFEDLTILGRKASDYVKSGIRKSSDGSIIIIIATDMPLDSRQLKRVARHAFLALGMLGSAGYHGSGDVCIAFSTQKGFVDENREIFDMLFKAAVECTYEAICDALFCAETMTGLMGIVQAMPVEWVVESGRRCQG